VTLSRRRPTRPLARRRAPWRLPARGAFLLRLLATFSGVLVLLTAGLFAAQSHDARRAALADGTQRQLARGEALEDLFASAEAAGADPWSAVRASLTSLATQDGVHHALLISYSGAVAAASSTDAQATELPASDVAKVVRTGEPAFSRRFHQGQEEHEYRSRVELAGAPYVLVVAVDPVVLHRAIATLESSLLRSLAIGLLLALPLLYLLGGRSLARRFGAAVDHATLDRLTGLPNLFSFEEALEKEVARAQDFGESLTLALLDVDDFVFVVASRGRQKGDDLLVSLGDALRGIRRVDRAFRVGGDQFAVILPHTPLDDAVIAVEQLRRVTLGRLDGTTLSAGLAVFEPAGGDLDAAAHAAVLRDHADQAMREAKHRGRNGCVTFPELAQVTPLRTSAATIAATRHLLTTRQMGAVFQPIWNLDTHTVFGYEGFARPSFEHWLGGPLDAFSGAARLGRIDDLDTLCRESVLARAGSLPDDVLLFLNITPVAFNRSGIGEQLRSEVEAAGLNPRQIVLELTEHAGTHADVVGAPLRELRRSGFRLAMDNVGAGERGLDLLNAVRPDFVKVDRALVCSARDGGRGRTVLARIVAYAAATGAVVIAERIETEEFLHHLERAGRTVGRRARFVGGQGYLLGRPAADSPALQTAVLGWPLPHGVGHEPLVSAS